MQILFVTPAFPPFHGGGERYARSLALLLAGRGHAITVLTSQARQEQDFWQGAMAATEISHDGRLTLIRCPIRPFPAGQPGLLAWRKLMVLLSLLPGNQSGLLRRMAVWIPPISGLEQALGQLSGRYDLVHGFNISWEHGLLAGLKFANQRAIPFVATPFAHLGESKRSRVALNSMMDHQRQLLHRSGRVLALTSVEKEGLAAWGIRPEQIEVVGGGLDPLPVVVDPAGVLEEQGVRQPFAIFIGRLSHDKGALHAAQAIVRLGQLPLVLVGRMTNEFDSFYGRLNQQERGLIRPVGSLSDHQKHALLSQATMLLLPSRSESFGIVLLEAWAHGVPVIGARLGGIRGVVDEGQNGLLVPFGDVPALTEAISQLWSNQTLGRQLGQCGRQKVSQQYNWEQVGDKIVMNYQLGMMNGELPLAAGRPPFGP